MKKSELVFVSPPSISHLVATIGFAKRLINKDEQILATILCIQNPLNPVTDALTKSLAGSETRIKLIDLPRIDPPPPELWIKPKEQFICANIENHIPHVRNTLKDLMSSHSNSHSTRLSGLVLDFVCMSLVEVAKELGLPSYLYLTCSLGFLSVMLHLPTHHDRIGTVFKDSDPDVIVPGFVNPVPTRVLPLALLNKDGGYTTFLELARRFRETRGIFVNSFEELESHDAVRALRSDGKTPPIYMVGPVVDLKGQHHPSFDRAQHENIMEWLDKQPDSSVLFLCFGSSGHTFGASQLTEIAIGVERSGYRFLWILRSRGQLTKSTTEDFALPEGFLERTKGRGMICEWALQVEVLAHKAVGGFVTHCGWNSILESLWCGVPIATWPTGAEQQLNAFGMVREFGLAVDLRLDYRDGADVVTAEEIETAIRRLMEGESESEVRKKVKEMSKMARNAVIEGGSSFNTLGQLVKDVIASS